MLDIGAMRQQFFNNKRQDIQNDATKQEQAANDVIQRRYASIGQAGSGSQIQTTLNNQKDINEAKQKALNTMSGDELQSAMQEHEAQAGREFSSGEAQKQRDFQRDLEVGQAGLNRAAQESQFARQLAMQQGNFDREMPLKERGLELQARQQELDRNANEVNASLGQYQTRHSGGLLGGGGVLGTGIGSGGK